MSERENKNWFSRALSHIVNALRSLFGLKSDK